MNRTRFGPLLFLTMSCVIASQAMAVFKTPSTADGKPDFSGVWQVLNTANDSLEAHTGRAAQVMQRRHAVRDDISTAAISQRAHVCRKPPSEAPPAHPDCGPYTVLNISLTPHQYNEDLWIHD